VNHLILIGIALGLAMDAFSVAIGVSISLGGTSKRQTFRLAWHFGFFQALMPIIGWAAGTSVRPLIERWDHWLAFVLLGVVGVHMIFESVRQDIGESSRTDPTRGWSLIVLSIATSVDALAVGLSFAALGVRVWAPAVVIGMTAAVMTLLGTLGGRALGARFGSRMSVVGGIVLIAIGFWILIEHLAIGESRQIRGYVTGGIRDVTPPALISTVRSPSRGTATASCYGMPRSVFRTTTETRRAQRRPQRKYFVWRSGTRRDAETRDPPLTQRHTREISVYSSVNSVPLW
jgi:putative Mn2+ efflux pump MntP